MEPYSVYQGAYHNPGVAYPKSLFPLRSLSITIGDQIFTTTIWATLWGFLIIVLVMV